MNFDWLTNNELHECISDPLFVKSVIQTAEDKGLNVYVLCYDLTYSVEISIVRSLHRRSR